MGRAWLRPHRALQGLGRWGRGLKVGGAAECSNKYNSGNGVEAEEDDAGLATEVSL